MLKILKCGLFVLVLMGCAKELSLEELKRESSMRQHQRLEKASGDYRGFVIVDETRRIPCDLVVSSRWNAEGKATEPVIQGALRIGLFGGVQLASSSAYFDWGTGELTIGFAKTGTSNRLEFRATIKDDLIQKATLEGPNQGRWNLELTKGALTGIIPGSETVYSMDEISGGKSVTRKTASVWIKRLPVDEPAPPSADLSHFPGLKTVVKLPYFSKVSQDVVQTLYDPLAGTIHFQLGDVSRMEVEGVYLPSGPLTGKIFLGNTVKSTVVLREVDRAALPLNPELPPDRYRGTFQTGPSTPVFASVSYLQFTGASVMNPADYVFRSFPSLRLVHNVCDEKTLVGRLIFDLEAVEYFDGRAEFIASNKKKTMELRISPDWKRLEGRIRAPESAGGEDWPRLVLSPDATLGPAGCDEL
jgi:hypothetical protein